MNVSGKASLSLFAFFFLQVSFAFSFPMPDKRSVCLKVGCECNTVTIKIFKIRLKSISLDNLSIISAAFITFV
jgi:hypothetical protein